MLNQWLDIDRVDYWFCVDDNSSEEDRKKMILSYSGIDYYWKTVDEKGHVKSMNIIWNKLNELKPKYWIHIEDDFLFFDRMKYISAGLNGFTNEIKQVLFNLNYSEVIEDYDIQGHIKLNKDYSVHDFKQGGGFNYKNQHYWPHYSFRPSIVEVDAILKLGDFTSPVTFFERHYADKWVIHYKSAFLNKITCKHIGKLTHEKHISNAYDLNQMNQFENSNMFILNLERRPDRKRKITDILNPLNIKYEFVKAIDGNQIMPNLPLKQMFDGNDFGNRKGVIGCALSHYMLWQKLLADKQNDYYIIMEDDFVLTPHFKDNFEKINFVEKELIFLGYHMFSKDRAKHQHIYDNYDRPLTIEPLNNHLYIGGTFTYSINKQGASKLLDYIKHHGIKHGIDFLIKIVPDLLRYETCPLLTTSDWNENGQMIDTDIQNKYDPMDFDLKIENYIFIPDVDSTGDDIYYQPNKTLDQQKSIADGIPQCIAFNTLGFFKNKINSLTPSRYFNKGDGIYIKESEYNKLNIDKSDKIRVKMLCNWCSSQQLCKEWSNMCEYDYTWKNIEITWENINIDYYVIINSTNEYYDPKKAFVFHMEPWVYDTTKNWGVKTWGKWIQPDCIKLRGRNTSYVNNVFWQLENTYSFWLHANIKKTDVISSICSSKYFDEGHIMRIDMLKYFESKGLCIDIYNQDNHHNFKNYKGPVTPHVDKYNGMVNYKYYFMIENNFETNFITEKLWEPILCESLCFYYGCPNVSEHMDPRTYVLLDTDFETSYQLIQKAISEDWHTQRLPYIKAAKEDLLHRMSFFPILYTDIQTHIRSYSDYFENRMYQRVCFIHSCHLANIGTHILEYIVKQVTTIEDVFDCIFIINIGEPVNIVHPKIKVIQYSSHVNTYELETINLIKTFSEKQTQCEILYLHTKGISNNNDQKIQDWTNMMLYFLIEKSNICIDHLKQYDAVGCNLSTNTKTPHFSGNFWWSKSSYIKSLPYLHNNIKHDAEWWILRNHTCKYISIHNSNVNHYHELYPLSKYNC
jgi:GR25 family glycosyltransferase involved in LPS biosynthesis